MLLVFEPNMPGKSDRELAVAPSKYVDVNGPWHVTLEPAIGEPTQHSMNSLVDLGMSDDPALNTFAGTAVYRTRFEASEGAAVLDLGTVASISEVTLNGKRLGVKWWGRHVYPIDEVMKPGENILEVRVTSVLYNYCHSLTDNRTASGWTNRNSREPAPVGLIGPVRLGIRP